MSNQPSEPKGFSKQEDLLLFAQLVTQSHQITLLQEHLQIMMDALCKLQQLWLNVEQQLIEKNQNEN